MNTLHQIHADIETRVRSIRDNHRDWLCRLGCDGCCRRLAEIPRLTAGEWQTLREGLTRLPPERLRRIGEQLAAWSVQVSRPLVCPLLNLTTGACEVYAERPVACRTYGYYVQRGQGLYCQAIATRVTDGDCTGVVWGNQDAIDRRLAELGETCELTEWFARFSAELAESGRQLDPSPQ